MALCEESRCARLRDDGATLVQQMSLVWVRLEQCECQGRSVRGLSLSGHRHGVYKCNGLLRPGQHGTSASQLILKPGTQSVASLFALASPAAALPLRIRCARVRQKPHHRIGVGKRRLLILLPLSRLGRITTELVSSGRCCWRSLPLVETFASCPLAERVEHLRRRNFPSSWSGMRQ
jgi:hypothetical protein